MLGQYSRVPDNLMGEGLATIQLPMASFAEGDVQACQVGREEVLVCRIDNQFYAVSGRCSHAGQRMAGGRLQGYEISCPLHGARFDVRTGACTRAPATAGLQRFPVYLEHGKVCVSIDDA